MSLVVRSRLAVGAARIGAHRLREVVRPNRPIAPGELPSSAEAITTRWLTHLLCAGHPGAEVVEVAVVPGSDGTSARRGLTVTYNEAGTAAGLPTALYAKSTPDLRTRLMCGLSGIGAAEANFYTVLRPALDIEAPHCHYAGYDQRDGRSMFVFDDIAVTRGATFADPRTTYVDRAMAESMVGLMATYHGAHWNGAGLRGLTWLRDAATFQRDINSSLDFARMTRRGMARAEDVVPPEVLRDARRIWPAFLESLVFKVEGPHTLLHQDVHTRNWYVTGDGRMGLYDWQAVARGSWAVDLAYALSSALTVVDRRAWERELLAVYLDRLRARGIEVPARDEAWLRYRQQMMHGMVLWLGTIGLSGIHQQTQPREVCLVHIERMTRAAADLDSVRLVAGA